MSAPTALQLLSVAVGGACGSTLRLLSAHWMAVLCPRFLPAGTLLVNLAGCLAIGGMAALAGSRSWNETVRQFWIPGFLGGLTTFSAFGLQTWELFRAGRVTGAVFNVGANVAGGLLCVAAGAWLAQKLVGE